MHYLEHDKDITQLSGFKTPARARYFVTITKKEDTYKIYESIKWMVDQYLPYILVTGGTNTLFAFDTYPGLVVYIDIQGWTYQEEEKLLICSAGDKIWSIAEALEYDYGQNIWHRFIGLPGSIAGAIYGNAGCFGLETESNFLDVEVLDLETGKQHTFSKKDMNFSYRNSRLKEEKKYCVLSARFDLSEKREKYSSDIDNIHFREEVQPKGKSCGSFFKNPSREQSAGFLIEAVGLKGYHLNGAYFSEKHANFLMHDGQGSYRDLLELIELARSKVQKEFTVFLENEVQIIYPHI